MKTAIVISPAVPRRLRDALRAMLPPAGGPDLLEIPAGADIAAAAAVCRRGYGRVVAMGGDGTVAAVSQALEGAGVPLGILPAGTGNLVARELGIPADPAAALRLALDPAARVRRIDAMRINGRLYLLNAGVGVNAEAAARTSRLGKALFGRSAYAAAAVWRTLRSKSVPLDLTVDGVRRSFPATDVLISNCGGLARALHPNGPDIRPDDGLLDVCVVCVKTPWEYPRHYLRRRFFPGRASGIIHETTAAESVEVACAEPAAVQADGDVVGTTPAAVALAPRAVALLTPP